MTAPRQGGEGLLQRKGRAQPGARTFEGVQSGHVWRGEKGRGSGESGNQVQQPEDQKRVKERTR